MNEMMVTVAQRGMRDRMISLWDDKMAVTRNVV